MVSTVIIIVIVLLALIFALLENYWLQWVIYSVNFNQNYYYLNSTLPKPLFQRDIPDEYDSHWKSISIYGAKEKGKSTFGKLLAIKRYNQHEPVIYVSLKEKSIKPCVQLGIAVGIYPKSNIKRSILTYLSSWINSAACDVSYILNRIADAASGFVIFIECKKTINK